MTSKFKGPGCKNPLDAGCILAVVSKQMLNPVMTSHGSNQLGIETEALKVTHRLQQFPQGLSYFQLFCLVSDGTVEFISSLFVIPAQGKVVIYKSLL